MTADAAELLFSDHGFRHSGHCKKHTLGKMLYCFQKMPQQSATQRASLIAQPFFMI
jgi:hypothetical protein